MELLKILAIFLLVFYGLKYLFRLLMPFALRKMTERLMNNAQKRRGGSCGLCAARGSKTQKRGTDGG